MAVKHKQPVLRCVEHFILGFVPQHQREPLTEESVTAANENAFHFPSSPDALNCDNRSISSDPDNVLFAAAISFANPAARS